MNRPVGLTMDCLHRLQATLQRRVAGRDRDNIVSVGFSPADQTTADQTTANPSPASPATPIARFDVIDKLAEVAPARRIHPIEPVRLFDRTSRTYQVLKLGTRVGGVGRIVPTGVSVTTPQDRATTSLVVRWTTVTPPPPRPGKSQPDDPRWRWGLLTVSHLFVGGEADASSARPRVSRVAACGDGPRSIAGRVARRGRIPGGPDVALIETGWDRLWLSGFMPQPDLPPLVVASSAGLVRRTIAGSSGEFVGDRVRHRWQWLAFYPSLMIDRLGRLQQLIAYTADQTSPSPPLGPGSSGGVLTSGGELLGMQVASMLPDFRVGYAQALDVGLGWLKTQLRASVLDPVHVVIG